MSFPRYPKYKDSGVEWLGEVPEHWELRRLKFLCDIQTGDKDTVDAIEDGLYPFFVRSQTVERINSCAFDCEAVLTAGDGVGVGKVFHYHNGPFDFHQRVYMLNRFREVSGPFLFHYLRENFYKVALEGGAKSTVDSLRRPLFTNFSVSVPPAEEQRSIVDIVERESAKIDELVAEQRRLIELLKEKRQAVISNAVTKGLNPHAPMKPSGIEWLGDVPEHWDTCLLKRAFQSVDYGISDALEAEGAVAILRMGNIENGKVVTDDLKYSDSIDPVLLLQRGDLLYNRTNSLELIGKVGMFEGGFESPISFASYLVRLRTVEQSLPGYFAYLLNTEGILGLARANAFVAIGQCNLNPTRYGQITVAIPPKTEQAVILAYLDSETAKLDVLTAEAQRAIDLLQERRTSLISAAVTGKIDVRGLVETEAA
jgi:type I restriction enzyme, S subunit